MVDDENVDFDGRIYFEESVVVDNLLVDSHLNGNDIQHIVRNGLRKNGPTVTKLKQLTVRGDVTFEVLNF